MHRTHTHLHLAALALGALLLTTGCATTVPASDTTPPEVALTVIGAGTTFTLTPTSADASRTVAVPDEVTLLASASDDQGVKNVWISGAFTVSCSQGELGQAVSIHYLANNPEDPSVGVGDEAVDQRLTSLEIGTQSLADLCRNGFTFNGASGGFQAGGENFHGGVTTTASLALQVDP
jgi:hypothetical protein